MVLGEGMMRKAPFGESSMHVLFFLVSFQWILMNYDVASLFKTLS